MAKRPLLLIHFHFPPDGLVGGQSVAKFAKYLPEFGWEPFVLTAQERYYTHLDPTTTEDVRGWDLVRRTRRILHPRYVYLALKALLSACTRSGSAATQPVAAMKKRSNLRRTLSSLLTLPDDLTGWIPSAVFTGLLLIRRHRIDRLFSSGPPWTNHLVGYALKRLTGVRWAACFRDPWTLAKATLAPEDMCALSLGLEQRLERAVVSFADAVICVNDFHREAMIAGFPDLSPAKFLTIPNGYDPEDFAHLDGTAPSPPTDRFIVTYTGTLEYNRTPRHLFTAVRRLIDKRVLCPEELQLRFIGHCALAEGQSVAKMAEEHGLGSVVSLRPTVPRREALRAMVGSHLLLLLAHDWVLQVPAKAYQYLRAGRPILALAPEGATADLIGRSGAGVVVDPYDVDGIAAHLERYLVQFKQGLPFRGGDPEFVSRFDCRRLTGALSSLLGGLGCPGGGVLTTVGAESGGWGSECPRP